MFRARVKPARGLRWLIFFLVAAIALAAVASDPAEARSRRKRSSNNSSYQPPYADIVVDVNSGKALRATNAESPRHPASLTKIMTLYLLFEQIEAGKLKLNSRLEVSEHASNQAPSKLGLKPGQTIEVEDAIKALVTKSANDVAVVVAEAIGGSEANFAKLMTLKAGALGMSRTTYRNASGLPDDDQITTARDQAVLGRAIQDRFPRYYRYFATPSFEYRGLAMRNHNKLLGRVEGVDGIKTGYTHASGFNLVTSMRRGNRHLVAVVLGGSSGSSRDARMRDLLGEYVAKASTQRTAPVIAETQVPREARPAKPVVVASAQAAIPAAPQPPAGSAEPIQPISVKTMRVKAGALQRPELTAFIAAIPQMSAPPPELANERAVARAGSAQGQAVPSQRQAATAPGQIAPTQDAPTQEQAEPTQEQAAPAQGQATAPAQERIAPAQERIAPVQERIAPAQEQAGPAPGQIAITAYAPTKPPEGAAPGQIAPPFPPPGARPGILGVLPATSGAAPEPKPAVPTQTPAAPTQTAVNLAPPARVHSGWIIQVGAFDLEEEAKERLRTAQNLARSLLQNADPFTERVNKGSKEFYRARFAGLDEQTAQAACKHLKRNEIACMALKN
jgi:D-alanyl-D-alanine carboxypeptidase